MKKLLKRIGLIFLTLVLIISILSLANFTNRRYQSLVEEGLQNEGSATQYITEDDITHLPTIIQSYLHYVGVVGTKRVHNFTVTFDGDMKMNKDADFSPYTGKQTSFINQGIRLFYMDLYLHKLKIAGLHHFDQEDARMKIKILDLFTVVDEKGEDMQKAETVTFFNDIVLFAPQALIDANIIWEEIDEQSIKAIYTHNGITISAILYFDEQYRITNFVSNDRFALDKDGLEASIPWATPIEEYQEINGLNLPKYGTALWQYAEGDFTYISLNIRDINYNIE